MNVDELAKKLLESMNLLGQQPTQSNPHLYPRRDMVWCGVCNGNHPSNECPRLGARPPSYGVDIAIDGETMRQINVDTQG